MRVRIPFLFIAVLVVSGPLCREIGALEYRNGRYGYSLDLPEGWKQMPDDGSGSSAFTDADSKALLQVFALPGGVHRNAEELYRDMEKRLGAKGEAERFEYSGRDAVFAEETYKAGPKNAKGYFVFLSGDPEYVLLAYAPEESFAAKSDVLLSSLNSFSPDAGGELLPGPVSQYLAPFGSSVGEASRVDILGRNVTLSVDAETVSVTQALIEREARILVSRPGEKVSDSAWRRYYRLAFRDSYYRLSDFGTALAGVVETLGLTDDQVPQAVLSWIQGFSYERTGTASDLLSPLAAGYSAKGDCDSRALLYVILLRYLSFDTTLFVSGKFSHSLAGVAVPGKGARMEAGGRSYLVAETTARVQLGLIDRTMADPSAWIAVPLPEPSGM